MSKASWMKNIFRATGIVVGLLAGCVGVRAPAASKNLEDRRACFEHPSS